MLEYQQDTVKTHVKRWFLVCVLSVLNIKMGCSGLEMQIKMFSAIKSVEACVNWRNMQHI